MKNNESEVANDIEVELLSLDSDIKVFKNVNFIKIKSKNYNLIIMKDYLPIIGEVQGRIEIGLKDDVFVLENVEGYYMHKHNKFNFFYTEKNKEVKEEIV